MDLRKTAHLSALLLLLTLFATKLLAQNTYLDAIPASIVGTYELTMTIGSGVTNSPIPDTTNAILSIAPNGTFCAEGIPLQSPFTKAGSGTTIYWSDPLLNLEFSISTTTPFTGIGVSNANSTSQYGSFTGEKTMNIAGDCGYLNAYLSFFELAEAAYPELFPASTFVFVRQNLSATYKYYPTTGIYLAASNGSASVSGGGYGTTPVQLGKVQNLITGNLQDMPVPVTSAPIEFDDYYEGTYNLAFQNATSFSPVANGTQLTFVITQDRKLCVGENILETPLYLPGNDGRIVWANPDGGYYYQLALLDETTKVTQIQNGTLQLFNSGGQPYGTFTGNRTGLSTECADALGENPDASEINMLFDLAEEHMPVLFPGGPQTYNQKVNGYIYRFYEESGVTIRIKDRQVFGKGGNFGSSYVFLGKLNVLIGLLQAREIAITIPASVVGTYTTTFTASGAFSPIADGAQLDFAIMENGSICVDGNILDTPRYDLGNRQLLRWKDTNSGFELSLDLDSTSLTAIELEVTSLNAVPLGTIAGSKTLMLAECAGILGGNIKVDTANALFALAEQYFPKQFPPSALTYNRFDGTSLLRYYPATGILITLTGDAVTARGGVYGATPVSLGSASALVASLQDKQPHSVSENLTIIGQMLFKQGNLSPITKRYDITREAASRPVGTDSATLIKTVQQLLGNELRGTSTFAVTVVADTQSELVFDVTITNQTQIVSTPILRTYTLRFRYGQ